jgi:hypothetical protein
MAILNSIPVKQPDAKCIFIGLLVKNGRGEFTVTFSATEDTDHHRFFLAHLCILWLQILAKSWRCLFLLKPS